MKSSNIECQHPFETLSLPTTIEQLSNTSQTWSSPLSSSAFFYLLLLYSQLPLRWRAVKPVAVFHCSYPDFLLIIASLSPSPFWHRAVKILTAGLTMQSASVEMVGLGATWKYHILQLTCWIGKFYQWNKAANGCDPPWGIYGQGRLYDVPGYRC